MEYTEGATFDVFVDYLQDVHNIRIIRLIAFEGEDLYEDLESAAYDPQEFCRLVTGPCWAGTQFNRKTQRRK